MPYISLGFILKYSSKYLIISLVLEIYPLLLRVAFLMKIFEM